MFTQSDINSLELAHTHAQSVKKKTALEIVFISLYERYKAGETLSKIEQRTLKDYLAVYRSELASLKKKAKMKNGADVILDKQKAIEAKQAMEKQKSKYEQDLIDLERYKDDLAKLSKELQKEKQQTIDLNKKLDSMAQNAKTNPSSRFLINAYQRYVSYDGFDTFNEMTDVVITLFMIAFGAISPKEADSFCDSFGSITTKNNKKCLRYSKKHENKHINLLLVHFTERFYMIGDSDKTDILAVVYVTDENEYLLSKASNTFVSLTTVDAKVAQALLDIRLQNTTKPQIYSEIDYKHENYKKISLILDNYQKNEEDYDLQIKKQFNFENVSFIFFRV